MSDRKASNHKNRLGFRHCMRCNVEYPLSVEFFHREKTRTQGFGYRCKSCMKTVAKLKPKRPDRYRLLTPEQKKRILASHKKNYLKTSTSVHRVRSYRAIDKRKGHAFDLDVAWYDENIAAQPCHYCGEKDYGVGCDRIDNSQGHTKSNVVPCCWDCNATRGARFSYDEMIVLGEAIRKIRAARNQLVTGKTLAQVRAAFESGKPFV